VARRRWTAAPRRPPPAAGSLGSNGTPGHSEICIQMVENTLGTCAEGTSSSPTSTMRADGCSVEHSISESLSRGCWTRGPGRLWGARASGCSTGRRGGPARDPRAGRWCPRPAGAATGSAAGRSAGRLAASETQRLDPAGRGSHDDQVPRLQGHRRNPLASGTTLSSHAWPLVGSVRSVAQSAQSIDTASSTSPTLRSGSARATSARATMPTRSCPSITGSLRTW